MNRVYSVERGNSPEYRLVMYDDVLLKPFHIRPVMGVTLLSDTTETKKRNNRSLSFKPFHHGVGTRIWD